MDNVLNVEPREAGGKGSARKLRAKGRIPGILYGHKERPLPFAVDPRDLRKRIKASGYGRNTVLQVKGLDREVLALVCDTQIDPVKRNLLHIDLIEVRADERVEVEVEVHLEGRPAGVVEGGTLQVVRRSVRLNCTPVSIPKEIVVDVRGLHIGQTLHIDDVTFPEGTEPAVPGTWALATIVAPAAAEAEGEGAGEAAAGESAG